MKAFKKYTVFVTLSTLLLLMLSACSGPGSLGPSGSSKPPAEVLQNSATAMKQLKSAHFTLSFSTTVSGLPSTTDSSSSSSTTIQSSSSSTTTINSSSSSTTIQSSSSSSTPSNLTLTINADGDEVLPDQTSLNLNITLPTSSKSQLYKLPMVVKGKQAYVQNSSGKWYELDLSAINFGGFSNPFASVQATNYNNLLSTLVKDANFTDHGTQNLNGENLRHITVKLGKNVLKDLLDTLGLSNTLTTEQQKNLDDSLKLENATLDVWIDESTSYTHRLKLKFNMSVDTNFQSTSMANSSTDEEDLSASSVKTAADLTIDFSKFNQTVSIPTPDNATLTSDPSVIFS